MAWPDVEVLREGLNPKILSVDSIQGLVFLLLLAYIIYLCVRRAFHFARWCVGLIFIFQLGHILAGTELSTYLPFLPVLFRYDVLTSLAQLCVGTWLSDGLLWINAYLTNTFTTAFEYVIRWAKMILPNFL